MKVLILADYFSPKSYGGAGIVSFDWAKALQKKGCEVSVITTSSKKDEVGESIFEGIKIFTLYSDYNQALRAYFSLYNPQVIGKIRKLIEVIKPDIVQAYNIHTYVSYASLKIAKRSGAKVFITMHDAMAVYYGKFADFINPNDLFIPKRFNYKVSRKKLFLTFKKRYNPFRNIIIRHYLKYVDKIFAVSNALKQVLNDNHIDNVEVIYNGINMPDKDVFDEEILDFRKKYNLIGKMVISFAGWVNGAKGGDQILLALEQIAKKIPNAVLLAVGRTDLYYLSMHALATKMGLDDKVVFTGWLSGKELRLSYSCSDVVTFPSICLDTFGMVNLEGMINKKPVVATCFGGAPEIVKDGVTGYIVNPYDIQTMVDRIIDLLTDLDKSKHFGEAGYDRAKKDFNFDSKVNELLSWYK